MTIFSHTCYSNLDIYMIYSFGLILSPPLLPPATELLLYEVLREINSCKILNDHSKLSGGEFVLVKILKIK